MKSGNVVEYIDRQEIRCAVVIEVKDQRLRLLTESDQEVSIPEARLTHASELRLNLSEERSRTIDRLREIADRRSKLLHQVDIQGLWKTLSPNPKWIDLPTMTGLCFPGNVTSDSESAVLRAIFNNRLYFKFSADRFYPHSAQKVAQRIASEKEARERERFIDDAARWLRDISERKRVVLSPAEVTGRSEIVDALKSVYLHEKESLHYTTVKTALAKAGLNGIEDIFGILVKVGLFDPNENIDLLRYRVPQVFPEDAARQAARLVRHPEELAANPHRKDLTMLSLLTIDGQATQDFDDALSIEDRGDHYRLGVHISDVGHFIKKGDPIDLAARRRCSSIYTPDRKIPMLPDLLSEGLCSLRAGEYRPAISLMIKLSPGYEILETEVVPSWVRVAHQFTYYEANQMSGDNRDIVLLKAIADRFRENRVGWGAIPIILPDINIWFDPEGGICVSQINRESPGRMLVSEIMIMANWLFARFVADAGLPAIFRSQDKPRDVLVKSGNGTLFHHWMQRRFLSRFELGHSPERHHGLGLDAYATATSPIRKYVDLVTQRQVRAALGLEKAYNEEAIDAMIRDLDTPMGQVALIQRNRTRYWLLKYLETRTGTRAEAIVLARRRRGYQILLKDYLLECPLDVSPGILLTPESNIQVTIQHVNPRKDLLNVYLS